MVCRLYEFESNKTNLMQENTTDNMVSHNVLNLFALGLYI